MGLYIKVRYSGDWWGEEESETGFETVGEVYRALSGQAKEYSYRALGRCTGKMYVDGPDGPRQVGWVFVARNPEPVNRGDRQPTGLREAWVSVHAAPDTVTRTEHFASFAGGAA
jgi:hypothetical protein